MTQSLLQAWIAEQRDYVYRRTPERRVQTVEQARAFVDEVGFCYFWPIKNIEMPNLLHAIAGRARDVPKKHADPDGSRCWSWKDQSLDKRWWYYGKLLRRRATLVSLDLLPTFYACSENYGDLMDYADEYRDGLMSAEAKDIYEALLEHGPLDTVRLRRESRMSADSSKYRFDRALVELQVGLKVIPVGVAETGAWNYAFIYEILQRHYPTLPEQAHEISRSQAQQTLILRYINNVVGTDRGMIAKIFHVLKWSTQELQQAIKALIRRELVQEMDIKGEVAPQLVSVRMLDSR